MSLGPVRSPTPPPAPPPVIPTRNEDTRTQQVALCTLRNACIATALVVIAAGAITAAIVFPLLPVVIVASIVAFAALMELGQRFGPAPIRCMVNYIRSSYVEVGAFCLTSVMYPFKASWGNADAARKTGGPVVVEIHGFAHNNSGFRFLNRQLRAAFPDSPIYACNLSTICCSLDDSREEFTAFMQEVINKHQGKPIILIGHSMGGIVASDYVTRHPATPVSSVITLGSPMQGTKPAYLVPFSPSAAQMRYHSPFMEDLQARVQQAAGRIRFFHIGSETDVVVRPAIAAMPADIVGPDGTIDPQRGYMLKDRESLGHLSLLLSLTVTEIAIREIRRATQHAPI